MQLLPEFNLETQDRHRHREATVHEHQTVRETKLCLAIAAEERKAYSKNQQKFDIILKMIKAVNNT